MQNMIAHLVTLQSIDTKLGEIEMLRGDLPKIVEQLKAELEELRDEINSDKQSVANFEKEKSDLTNEQSMNQEKLKKFQDQLYKATSNKEYEATSAQIDFCEQELNRIKLRSIDIDAQVMELQEGVKPKEERLAGLEKDFSEREGELQTRIEETSKEENELRQKREGLKPQIRPDLINKYERIRKAKNGIAVAPLVKEASCGGCFQQIPPQIIIELKKREKLTNCEYCGRILYIESDVVKEASAS